MHRSSLSTALLVLLGLILASEVGLRLLTAQNSRWNVRLGVSKEWDPAVFFRNKRNYDFPLGGSTNEYGYLNAPKNLQVERPDDALRLIFLGDSATFLPHQHNYPGQVGRILERDYGIPAQIVNTAVPGHASENTRLLFETEVSKFDADYLFVYIGWNDLGQFGPEGLPYKRHRQGYSVSLAQRALSHVYSARFVYAGLRALRRYQPTVDEPLDERERALYVGHRPEHYYDNLGAILDLAKQRYPRVYVMTLATITNSDPTPDELRKAHFPTGMDKNMRKLDTLVESYNEAVHSVAAAKGVPILDLYELCNSHEAREDFTDSAHFNKHGAARIAAYVAREVARREAAEPSRAPQAAAAAP